MTPFHPGFHPRAIFKLQTARFRTLEELQTRDLDQKMRLDELYLAIGGLGGQKLELNLNISKKLTFEKYDFFVFQPETLSTLLIRSL